MEKSLIIKKFGLGVRLTHWINAILIIGAIITGYSIYSGIYILGDYAANLHLHMILVFFILMDSLSHIYFMKVTGEKQAIWMSWKDIKDIITIARNFLGLTKEYPEYGTYDVKSKKFYGKYHPVVKLKYWGDMWFLGFAAVSGFILYFTSVLNSVNSYLGIVGLELSLLWWKLIHFLVFIYFLCVLIFHTYLSLIPSNRQLLSAMLYGKEKVEVHVDQT